MNMILYSVMILGALAAGSLTGAEMVLVPGGEFVMGNAKGKADQKPVRKVKNSAFYIDKTRSSRRSTLL